MIRNPVCVCFVAAIAVSCGGSRSVPAVTGNAPASSPAAAEASPVELFQSGQYERAAAAVTPSDDPGLVLASRLVLAARDGDGAAVDRGRADAEGFASNAIVQFAVGIALMARGDAAEAARAFDRSIAADPSFAYAYYHAGLAYEKLGRADLVANRFETFVRLRPQAPERPGVESILRTVRGR